MISHEAEELKGIVDYDMEAFRNEDFGVLMFESLAREMNYEGEYVGMVGALTCRPTCNGFRLTRLRSREIS